MTKKKPAAGKPRAPAHTVSLVLARETFGELVNRTQMLSERIYITRHGKRVAALVPIDDAELLECLEVEVDLRAVKKARADIVANGTVSLTSLKKSLGR